MCSRSSRLALLVIVLVAAPLARAGESAPADADVLRVCADPNNLPFSNEAREGFENRLADLVAREMHAEVRYTWWAQRRGFFRNTLNAGACDVVMGVPTAIEMAETTRPYYRSTYVFVSRVDRGVRIQSFDDPRLRRLHIGVQMIGDDFANTPPAHALSRRGLIANVTGYSVYGDYAQPNPPARIVDAVAAGDVDVAVVWGPLAGYFATRQRVPLDVRPVVADAEMPALPFAYDISMGVRRGEAALKRRLDEILARRRAAIDRLLADYHVPRVGASHDEVTKRRHVTTSN